MEVDEALKLKPREVKTEVRGKSKTMV